MLTVVEGFVSSEQNTLFDQMFRQRKAVFHDKKGWDVTVTGEWEIDEFDTPHTLYLLSVGPNDELLGSVRLLSTVGIHMHSSVFSHWFNGIDIQSPLIWEATRFCIQSDLIGREAASIACKELLQGMFEIGKIHGWVQITSVYERAVGAIYKRYGIDASVLAEHEGDHGLVKLGVADVSNMQLNRIRAATGIQTLDIEYAHTQYSTHPKRPFKQVA